MNHAKDKRSEKIEVKGKPMTRDERARLRAEKRAQDMLRAYDKFLQELANQEKDN